MPAKRNQLRGDRNRDLFGRDSTNVESDGRMHTFKQMRRQTFLLQSLENSNHFALGSDHANVASARRAPPSAAVRMSSR
jgi:hypothetical protein